jgi:hypothetical protein
VFCCAIDFFEAGGAAIMMTTQAVEIMDAFLKEYRWKFTRKCQKHSRVGCWVQ